MYNNKINTLIINNKKRNNKKAYFLKWRIFLRYHQGIFKVFQEYFQYFQMVDLLILLPFHTIKH